MDSRVWPVVGVVLVVIGLVWVGQGLGYVEGSFMTDDRKWAVIGAVTAAVGSMLLLRGRRRP